MSLREKVSRVATTAGLAGVLAFGMTGCVGSPSTGSQYAGVSMGARQTAINEAEKGNYRRAAALNDIANITGQVAANQLSNQNNNSRPQNRVTWETGNHGYRGSIEGKKISLEHGALQNNEVGIGIETNIIMWEAFGKTVQCITYVTDSEDQPVKTSDAAYARSNGDLIAGGERVKIGLENCEFHYKVFLPARLLSTGGAPSKIFKINMVLYDRSDNNNDWIPLSQSEPVPISVGK